MNWDAIQAVAELSAAVGVLLSPAHLLTAPFVEFLDVQILSASEPPLLQFRSRWEETARPRRERND